MRRTFMTLLIVACTVPLAGQSAMPTLQVPYTQFKLANGLTVILHQDKSVPVVTVNVWYHVGSANEKPGRTGFAHLVRAPDVRGIEERQGRRVRHAARKRRRQQQRLDEQRSHQLLHRRASNALELALYLESDRMAYLLDTMTPQRVNGQRDVVKNERRQSYENQPYGMASIEIDKMLWPANHPYNWPTIGYMEDLTAASQSDVVEFFKKYYVPNNASLVIAGDIDIAGPERSSRNGSTRFRAAPRSSRSPRRPRSSPGCRGRR